MGARKKGSRRIVVDGVVYLWRVPRRPASGAWDGNSGFTVTVQREDHGGSVLALTVRHQHPAIACVWGNPPVSILQSQVAVAIRQALAEGWQPSEKGAAVRMALPLQTDEARSAPD